MCGFPLFRILVVVSFWTTALFAGDDFVFDSQADFRARVIRDKEPYVIVQGMEGEHWSESLRFIADLDGDSVLSWEYAEAGGFRNAFLTIANANIRSSVQMSSRSVDGTYRARRKNESEIVIEHYRARSRTWQRLLNLTGDIVGFSLYKKDGALYCQIQQLGGDTVLYDNKKVLDIVPVRQPGKLRTILNRLF